MILNRILNNIGKQAPKANHVVNNQLRYKFNDNFINYRKFTSTPPNRFIESSTIITSADWLLTGSIIALPFALSSKSPRSSVKLVKILSALSIIGSLLILSASAEANPYTGKIRLLFKDLESEKEAADLEELYTLNYYKIIKEVDPVVKENIDNILTKLRKSSGESIFSIEVAPKWYLIDSEDSLAFGLPNGSIFIYKGLLNTMENNDQLAYFLAQTLSHQLLRHETEKSSIKSILNSLTFMGILSISLLTPWTSTIQWAGGLSLFLANKSILNTYARDQSREADSVAFYLTTRSGYNPEEFKQYWDTSKPKKSSLEFINDSKLLSNLSNNIHYLLSSDQLTSNERAWRIQKNLELNNRFVKFVKDSPNYNWLPLNNCEFWLNRKTI